MLIGYARTSTTDQRAGLDAQLRDLKAAGCERVWQEHVSSVARQRPELDAALDFVREGDTFIVTKLDRLARSTLDLWSLVGKLQAKKVELNILNLGLDTGTATGKLLLNMIGAVAQFEREMMLERQREGIAKAKSEGKFKGRQPTARRQRDDVAALAAEGLGATEIRRRLTEAGGKISQRSVERLLAEIRRGARKLAA